MKIVCFDPFKFKVIQNGEKSGKGQLPKQTAPKSGVAKKGGKGLLPKYESIKEFIVQTKVKYRKCMDPLLECDHLKPGELEKLCWNSTDEPVTDFDKIMKREKGQHLCSLFGRIEGHNSDEYMRKWLGFFSTVHWQAIVSKAGRYMKLKKMTIDQWADGLKINQWGDICRAHWDGGSCQGDTRHSLPPVRRWGGFNFDNQLNSSIERCWRRTGYYGLSRLSKIRQTIPLPLKQTQALEEACFLVNYSLKQEPNKSSSLKTRCHKVLGAMTCPQVPRADEHTHFYMECDVMFAVYIRTLWAQWQESL